MSKNLVYRTVIDDTALEGVSFTRRTSKVRVKHFKRKEPAYVRNEVDLYEALGVRKSDILPVLWKVYDATTVQAVYQEMFSNLTPEERALKLAEFKKEKNL